MNKERTFKFRNTSWDNFSLDEYINWEFNRTLFSWYKFERFWWNEKWVQNYFEMFMRKKENAWLTIKTIFLKFHEHEVLTNRMNKAWMNYSKNEDQEDLLDDLDDLNINNVDESLEEDFIEIWDFDNSNSFSFDEDYSTKNFNWFNEIYVVPVKDETVLKQTINSYKIDKWDLWMIQEYMKAEKEEWWFQEWNLIDFINEEFAIMIKADSKIEVELREWTNTFKSAKLNWKDVLEQCIYYSL